MLHFSPRKFGKRTSNIAKHQNHNFDNWYLLHFFQEDWGMGLKNWILKKFNWKIWGTITSRYLGKTKKIKVEICTYLWYLSSWKLFFGKIVNWVGKIARKVGQFWQKSLYWTWKTCTLHKCMLIINCIQSGFWILKKAIIYFCFFCH